MDTDDAGDKYAHIRAYLSALERENVNKSPTDSSDVPDPGHGALAARIAALLVEDDEDEVKNILVEKIGVQEASVSTLLLHVVAFSAGDGTRFTA